MRSAKELSSLSEAKDQEKEILRCAQNDKFREFNAATRLPPIHDKVYRF